jgi:hypothetical protein
VDRLVLSWGALLAAVPLLLEFRLIGWLAAGETAVFVALGLLGYEWIFAEWQKLPFTCSQLPGKTPGWILGLWGLGILMAFPAVYGLISMSIFSPIGLTIVLSLVAGVWTRLRSARRVAWGELRLKYDELPEPAVHGLNLVM